MNSDGENKIRDNWEDGNPGSWGASPQYQVRRFSRLEILYVCNFILGTMFIFLSHFDLFSLEVLHQDHMKPRLLVLDGLVHLVEIIVKLERLGTVLPMVSLHLTRSKQIVYIYFLFLC